MICLLILKMLLKSIIIAKIFSFALMDRTTNVINMLKFLMKVKSPYDVLEENFQTSSIHRRAGELYVKYKKLIEKAKKEIVNSGKIFFFKYAGDTGMSADIANRLKYLFPEKIILVARISGAKASFSIRGKDIREKVVKAISKLKNATGGGHEDAVGGSIKVEDVEKFRENLEKEI